MDFNKKCVKILPLQADSTLKCGVCGEFLVIPPIYSCLSVKYICGPCFEGYRYYLDDDDLRAADRPVRQILYENYASRIQFPCSYYPHCRGIMSFDTGAKLHYKEYCFAKVLWIFRCPISKANRWFLRPFQRHCNVGYKLDKLYDNENVKLMRHIRNHHNEYVLERPYILDLKSLKNNTQSRQLFVLLMEENDVIAVLMTEITKTDIIFRCRVNDSVDSRSMTADPYECCVNLVPPNERFSSIMDLKFECVQLDNKDIEYPWQSLRLPIRHLIDETVFKICVFPHSLLMRCLDFLQKDRQPNKNVEYIRCPSETTMSSTESERTDIELLSFPSSNSENPPIEFGKTASELWGIEGSENIENSSINKTDVGLVLNVKNEFSPDAVSPCRYEENQEKNKKLFQEEKKLSASRKLFSDDIDPSREDFLSKVVLDFSDSSVTTSFPGVIQELILMDPPDQEENKEHYSMGKISPNQTSEEYRLSIEDQSLQNRSQQIEILSSEIEGKYESISNDQSEKEEYVEKMRKKSTENLGTFVQGIIGESSEDVNGQNQQNETLKSNNVEENRTNLKDYTNESTTSKASSLLESESDDLQELLAFVSSTQKNEDHKIEEMRTSAENVKECTSSIEYDFFNNYQQNEISTTNSKDVMKTEGLQAKLEQPWDVEDKFNNVVLECSSSEDIMPNLELFEVDSRLPSVLEAFEGIETYIQECSSSKDIVPSSDSASIDSEFPSVLQDFEVNETEPYVQELVREISSSDNICSSDADSSSKIITESVPADANYSSHSTSTPLEDLPELIEIVSSTKRGVEENDEMKIILPRKNVKPSVKAIVEGTTFYSSNIVHSNDEKKEEKRRETRSRISSKENISSLLNVTREHDYSFPAHKKNEISLIEEKKQINSNKKDVLSDITHDCINEKSS